MMVGTLASGCLSGRTRTRTFIFDKVIVYFGLSLPNVFPFLQILSLDELPRSHGLSVAECVPHNNPTLDLQLFM
jgi:hypothetical protein